MKKLMTAALMLAAGVTNAGTYAQTKYPIVLVPGVLPVDKVMDVEYFYGIADALREEGAFAFNTPTTAFTTSEARGEQVLSHVKAVLAVTGAKKVNLIGHGQGGFSARYVAGTIPGNVASVTTVGSPVKGTPVGDLMQQAIDVPGTDGLASTISNTLSSVLKEMKEIWVVRRRFESMLFGSLFEKSLPFDSGKSLPFDDLSEEGIKIKGWNEEFKASMASMSSDGAAAFNAKFPAGVPMTSCGDGASAANGQRFYSMGGTKTYLFPVSVGPLDKLFIVTSSAIKEANDGLVGRCSNHFGAVVRDNYLWNHGEEINQLRKPGLFIPQPGTVYRSHANRLRNARL